MNMKQARRKAKRFLWHLEQPRFDHQHEVFDHEHWWSGKEDKVPVEAVVWEIMRRHPIAERVHQRWNSDDEMNELQFQVGRDGFRSWPKLTAQQQGDFKKRLWKLLPPQRGFAPPPVTVLNNFRPFDKYMRKLKSKKDNEGLEKIKTRLEHRLCAEMLSHYRGGQIIVAIDPSANRDRAAKGIKQVIQEWRGVMELKASGKNRTKQRLKVIANFERKKLDGTFSKNSSEAQLLTRYHTTIENFPLPLS